jgi:hypothetical protein
VETSNGRLLLEISHLIGGLSVAVNAFDDDGWEERSRRTGWQDPDRRARGYVQRGGKTTLAEAIRETADIGADEAQRIADGAIHAWESHLTQTEITESREAWHATLAFLVVLAMMVIAFIALLIVLAVVLLT